ncbi:MAG: FAD-dependent oxidoreductase [Dehalococcoidia bacterium]|nr:FAD-dependent oxidoreductase [Dehalococcoidia bacterium]
MKVSMIGGGGGASNAANVIRRLNRDAQIDIFTNREGIGHQPCEIPFVLKGEMDSWEDTGVFGRRFYEQRGVGVHFNTQVTDIIREEKVFVANGEKYSYDKLILDLGSIPTKPPIQGIDGRSEYVLATDLATAKVFEEIIPKCSRAAIIGTGQIALEVAGILKAKGYDQIYLLGRADHILRAYLDKDMSGRIEQRIKEGGIELILSARMNSIASCNGKKVISLPDREIEADFIFFATGSRPNVDLAQRAGIQIGETGGILVNEYLQTSDSDIYAIGDCTESWDTILGKKRPNQTATSAARGGRIAATNLALGNVLPYQGTAMPFITDVFGYQVGTVGFTESYAREEGIDVFSDIKATATRRRSFGGKSIYIKLVADRKTRTLVGAQLISQEMVAGKIDRLSVAIAERIPIERLSLIDTCYFPTTGSAYESVTMALDELRLKLDGR